MDAIGIVSCLGFVAVVVGWGAVAHGLTARRSGWDRLSQRYPAGRRSPRRQSAGARFGRATVGLNGRWYRHHLQACVDGAGIRLSVPPPFRPFHPPIFVPWDDVIAADAGVNPGGDAVLCPGGSAVAITLTGPVARAAERALARRAGRTRPRSRP